MEKSLYQKLKEYARAGYLPMHMPGHKRNRAFLKGFAADIDITEIDGFDNLHDMNGVLLETSKLAAKLYGAKMCYPLVNGSSAGILAAVTAACACSRACAGKGDDKGAPRAVLMARNCHKSVYNAVQINRLKARYLYPSADEYGILAGIDANMVEKALAEHADICAVIITSPTFEGVTSDIGKISSVCHGYGVPLIVDAAHGAHFGFEGHFPKNAVECGADYVVMSLHKTLPALTQCALLAVSGEIDLKRVELALSLYETTSPSYILMAAIDECLRTLHERGAELFSALNFKLEGFYREVSELKKLKLLMYDDPSRLVVSCRGTDITGVELADVLRKDFLIEPEMAYTDYIVLIATICDEEGAYDRLADALKQIDKRRKGRSLAPLTPLPRLKAEKDIHDALFVGKDRVECVGLRDANERVSAQYVYAYPPGIPLIVPGEVIDESVTSLFEKMKSQGVGLHSTYGKTPEMLYVLKK